MKRLLSSRNTFAAVIFFGLFAMAARNVTDPDIWWHLKTGQYIAEHKTVPRVDPFSFTRAGEPWVAHEWLTELFLYEAWRISGWGGLIVLFALILCVAFFLLFLRCGPDSEVAAVATLAAAWVTMPVWGVRPQMVSLLLTSLWLLILERSERNPKLLWWTLPLTVLWVNLHAGFALGLVLSGLFLAGDLLERALGYTQRDWKGTATAASALLLDVLLVPLNPNGTRMFSYPIETLRSPAMQKYIAEWASPNFHLAQYWPFLILILTTLAAFGGFGLRARPRDILLLVVSLFAGLVSVRMIPLLPLIAVPLLTKRIAEWPGQPRTQRVPTSNHVLLNAGIVLILAVFAAVHTTQVIRYQSHAEMQHFPVHAVEFLEKHPLEGRVFNHYDWGGYLIWKLYPSTRVFVDGRADLYSEMERPDRENAEQQRPFDATKPRQQTLFDNFARTYDFEGGWQETLRRWDIRTVVVPPDSAIATGLRNAPGWAVLYTDSQAVILTARRGEL
jgi:hypothetical protein